MNRFETDSKRALLEEYIAKLEHGPVLSLPLTSYSIQFKPQSLVPLDDIGTVYPSATIADEWGNLTVASGGMLIRKHPPTAVISAAGFDQAKLEGHGFILHLKLNWTVGRDVRSGDLIVQELRGITK